MNRIKGDFIFTGFQNPCQAKASSRGSESRGHDKSGFLNSMSELCVKLELGKPFLRP